MASDEDYHPDVVPEFVPRDGRPSKLKPHEKEGRPKPMYGDTRPDGRRFRGWTKNASGGYREHWLKPESWEKREAKRQASKRSYEERNRAVKNAERKARLNGTLEEAKRDGRVPPRLAISTHGMTAEEFNALTPEAQDTLRKLDLLGRE